NYAREKLACERLAVRLGHKLRKKVYVLRLGHVCGELQGITNLIRDEIAAGRVRLPAPDRKSNVVYVATIADAILQAAAGELGEPGVYDLLNSPQWTWKEVYGYEGQRAGQDLKIETSGHIQPVASHSLTKRVISGIMAGLLRDPMTKEYAMQLI